MWQPLSGIDIVMGQVTALLSAVGQGEPEALDELYSLLYPELRRLARSRVRRSGEMALLDTTSLVHESYLRFEKAGAVSFGDRSRFLAYAAQVMRSVVVDLVRQRQRERRGCCSLAPSPCGRRAGWPRGAGDRRSGDRGSGRRLSRHRARAGAGRGRALPLGGRRTGDGRGMPAQGAGGLGSRPGRGLGAAIRSFPGAGDQPVGLTRRNQAGESFFTAGGSLSLSIS